jgi:thiamine transport system permease protein
MRRAAGTALLLAAPAALVAVGFAWPMAQVLRAATPDAWHWLGESYVRERLAIAAGQAACSVALTFAWATPLALLHHLRKVPSSRLLLALHAAPFVLPVFVVVYGLQMLLGPQGWLGRDVLGALGPFGAIVLAHAYYNHGFAANLLHATLERRPRGLEEAAATLGAPPRSAVWRTTVALLWPAAAGMALLVFLFAFASFGTVLLLGEGKVSSTETLIYQLLGGVFPQVPRAAVLGTVQLLLAAGLLLGYAALHRRLRLPREPEHELPPAGRAWTTVAIAAAVVSLLPAAAVLAGGFRVRGRWTLDAWRTLLDPARPDHQAGFTVGHAVAVSLGYAAATVVLAVGLSVALAYAARRMGRVRAAADALAALPLGGSSLLLGLGLLLAYGPGSVFDLRGWPGLVVAAHTLVAFPFVARILLPALLQHDARLDEAAAVLGAPPRAVAWRVHRPLLAAPLAAAAGFAAALSLGDYGASLLLTRPGTMPLASWILRHDHPFDPLAHAQAVALAGLLAALAMGALLVAEAGRLRWLRRRA